MLMGGHFPFATHQPLITVGSPREQDREINSSEKAMDFSLVPLFSLPSPQQDSELTDVCGLLQHFLPAVCMAWTVVGTLCSTPVHGVPKGESVCLSTVSVCGGVA
jgi:hypothetical protein